MCLAPRESHGQIAQIFADEYGTDDLVIMFRSPSHWNQYDRYNYSFIQ